MQGCMPISYTIEIAKRVVHTRAWGVLCNADLRDYYRALMADLRFLPDLSCLLNLEGVNVFALESRVIAEIASWPVFNVGVRRAIVAPSDVAFGLSRMFSLHAESAGQNVMAFRNEVAAEAWLSSPTDVGQVPARLPCGNYMRVA